MTGVWDAVVDYTKRPLTKRKRPWGARLIVYVTLLFSGFFAVLGLFLEPAQTKLAIHNMMLMNPKLATRQRQDICLVRWVWRSFNRIITLANALRYAELLSQNSSQPVHVLLDEDRMRFVRDWFDLSNHTNGSSSASESRTRIKLLDSTNEQDCRTPIISTKDHFFGRKLPESRQYREGQFFKGYQPSVQSLPPLRNAFYTKAKEALQRYQQYHQKWRVSKKAHPTTKMPKTVTVHVRWLEGMCESRALDGEQFTTCPIGKGMGWGVACRYNETYVRHRLPFRDKDDRERAVIIMLGDGDQSGPVYQEPKAQFSVVDKHDFGVQVAMMVLSDYHFGNPMSTVDAVVAHWRAAKQPTSTDFGHQTFPEDCYREILEKRNS